MLFDPVMMLIGAGTGIDPLALAPLVAVSCFEFLHILPTYQVNIHLMGP
ncbi:MAG: hypothetical protein LUQ33_01495 [Methanoregulaceae archaeon]|nr:hypothetical protein [Methanoregulaceae archaeon]